MPLAVASALAVGVAPASATVITIDGSFTSYTTVVGASDPYSLGLPEPFTVTLNTSGNTLVSGAVQFTGAGQQRTLSGGTITIGATFDFFGVSVGGAPGGSMALSWNTAPPNLTTAGLQSMVGRSGTGSVFGFPFTNGAQGFYSGSVRFVSASDAVAVPVPGTAALVGIGLIAAAVRTRRRA